MSRSLVVTAVVAMLAVLSVGVAAAAWRTEGTGTSAARAGTLTAPTVTRSAVACQMLLQRVTLTWTTPEGASGTTVDVSTTGSFPGTTTSGTATSTTLTAKVGLSAVTYSVRVRATAGSWTGPWSPTTTVTLSPCVPVTEPGSQAAR